MKFVPVVAAATLLSACTPEYNWREVRSADDGFRVMLPGKPATMKRRIRLGETEVSMSMTGARAGGTAFTAGCAELPDDSGATREAAIATMRAAMVRNIAGTERASARVDVAVIGPDGAAIGRLGALRVDATGAMRDGPATMVAGFVGIGRRACQWVALGPSPDPEHTRTFVESFRLEIPRN